MPGPLAIDPALLGPEHHLGPVASQILSLWIKYGGDRYVEDVLPEFYPKLQVGHRVPLMLVKSWPQVFQLGARPTIHMGALIVLLPALFAFIVYMFVASQPIGWWEGKVEDVGGGRLPAPD